MLLLSLSAANGHGSASVGLVTIDLARGPVNRIDPGEAFGAAVDGTGRGGVASLFTPFNVARMRAAGLEPVIYRTRAELGIEAWHWNQQGSWSDTARAQGYWTSDPAAGSSGPVTWGYALPRRGDTFDQANNAGYSRLDDGDPITFWKSNPYLDRRYTGVANRPQWIVADFGARTPIDAARIEWARPYATRYQIEYWNRADPYDEHGRWVRFPGGAIRADRPDDTLIRLAAKPIRTKFVRILLLRSSGAAPAGSSDPRDGMGYAVCEIHLGVVHRSRGFQDLIRHGAGKGRQSAIIVSSTDPWHRAVDRDLDLEQPGFDLVFGSGITNGLPMTLPVGLLYDTPENAVAEIRYLRARGFRVGRIELGEEPDGQGVSPEDYAELYLETARALHAFDPTLALGGPSLQSAFTDTWPDPGGGRSWTRRFIARLKARGALGELGFFSFEHYPFDDLCGALGPKLLAETRLMGQAVSNSRRDGVPTTIPWLISEYGFSAFSGRAMSQTPSALLDADIVGQFLTLGGKAAFLFGYGPDWPANQHAACAGFGNMMLFEADTHGQANLPMPAYYFARLLTGEWGQAASGPNALYRATSSIRDARGRPLVTAYALARPDRVWSVLLVNRDPNRAHDVRIVFRGRRGYAAFGGRGGVAVSLYSPDQYRWLDAGAASHPDRDLPPDHFALADGERVTLPAWSLAVLRGSGPGTVKSGRPRVVS